MFEYNATTKTESNITTHAWAKGGYRLEIITSQIVAPHVQIWTPQGHPVLWVDGEDEDKIIQVECPSIGSVTPEEVEIFAQELREAAEVAQSMQAIIDSFK